MSVKPESEETKRLKSVVQKSIAAKNQVFDPMFYHRRGAIGGSVTGVKKGFAGMSEEKAKAIRAKAQETRKRNAQSK